MSKAKIVVIGGGMAGASIAAELAAHAEVVLIEAETTAGYHTTGRSAAIYHPLYGNEAVSALTRASYDFYTSPPPGFTEQPLLGPRNAMFIVDAENLAALESPHYAGLQRLSIEEARAIVPILRPEAFVTALFDTEAADIEVDLLHRGYLKLARTRGAQILLGHRISDAQPADGGWLVTSKEGGEFMAELVVNASGAWGDPVGSLFGAAPLGLSPRRRTMLLVDPPEDIDVRDWPLTITVQEDLYFKGDAGKIALSPADETEIEPCDAQPEELDIAIAVDRFQTLTDVTVKRISHSWAGLRTFAPDRVPVIGHDPQVPGLFWFVGQGGYGIQMAPAAAKLGAALALEMPFPDMLVANEVDPTCYSPTRLALQRIKAVKSKE